MTEEEKERFKKFINTTILSCHFIKPEKWEEFKQLHLSRFRYEFDKTKNRYYRKFRKARKIDTIYINPITRYIFWEDFNKTEREVPQTMLEKLFNRGMVETIRKEVVNEIIR